MHWRERARVREFRDPPEPPERVSVPLSGKPLAAVKRDARKAGVTIGEWAALIITNHYQPAKPAGGNGK